MQANNRKDWITDKLLKQLYLINQKDTAICNKLYFRIGP